MLCFHSLVLNLTFPSSYLLALHGECASFSSILVQNCDVYLMAFSSYRFSGGPTGNGRTEDKNVMVLGGTKSVFSTCPLQYVLVVIACDNTSWSQYVTRGKEVFPFL